jgi:CBS domain-containing protein
MITSEMARDIMNRELIHALEDDSLDKVVERMIQAGVKEIAILDGEKKLVGDLTMLDLLKYFHLPK